MAEARLLGNYYLLELLLGRVEGADFRFDIAVGIIVCTPVNLLGLEKDIAQLLRRKLFILLICSPRHRPCIELGLARCHTASLAKWAIANAAGVPSRA